MCRSEWTECPKCWISMLAHRHRRIHTYIDHYYSIHPRHKILHLNQEFYIVFLMTLNQILEIKLTLRLSIVNEKSVVKMKQYFDNDNCRLGLIHVVCLKRFDSTRMGWMCVKTNMAVKNKFWELYVLIHKRLHERRLKFQYTCKTTWLSIFF